MTEDRTYIFLFAIISVCTYLATCMYLLCTRNCVCPLRGWVIESGCIRGADRIGVNTIYSCLFMPIFRVFLPLFQSVRLFVFLSFSRSTLSRNIFVRSPKGPTHSHRENFSPLYTTSPLTHFFLFSFFIATVCDSDSQPGWVRDRVEKRGWWLGKERFSEAAAGLKVIFPDTRCIKLRK